MKIFYLEYRIKLTTVFSLKDKRSLRLRLFNQLKKKFNISILENNQRDSLDYLSFGICFLAPDTSYGDGYFEKIDDFISSSFQLEDSVIDVYKEII